MKKIVMVSAIILLPLIFLTGCSKVSLTGTTGTATPAGGAMGTPPDGGGTPPSGAPSDNGGTPPSGATSGGAAAGAPSN